MHCLDTAGKIFKYLEPTSEPSTSPLIPDNELEEPEETQDDYLWLILIIVALIALCIVCCLCVFCWYCRRSKKVATNNEQQIVMSQTGTSQRETAEVPEEEKELKRVVSQSETTTNVQNEEQATKKEPMRDSLYVQHTTIGMMTEEKTKDVQNEKQTKRMESTSESYNGLYAAQTTKGLYAAQTTGKGVPAMVATANGGGEGLNKYADIERMLKIVDPDDYEQYLNNFKREKVDDARLQKYKLRYSRENKIWGEKLIPAHGPCEDFLDLLYADV